MSRVLQLAAELAGLSDDALVRKIAALKTIERQSRGRDRDCLTSDLQSCWCECIRRMRDVQAAEALFQRGLDVVRKEDRERRENNQVR